jgi:hypothetical protein
MITTGSFNSLVKNAYVQWQQARAEFPSVRSELARISSVSEQTSEHSEMSSLPTARRRSEGQDAWKGSLKQGYTKNFFQREIALQVDVTKQMRMFDKYDLIYKRMREMGRAVERRIELDLALLLSYAWSSSYTNLDGETITTTTPDGNPLKISGIIRKLITEKMLNCWEVLTRIISSQTLFRGGSTTIIQPSC